MLLFHCCSLAIRALQQGQTSLTRMIGLLASVLPGTQKATAKPAFAAVAASSTMCSRVKITCNSTGKRHSLDSLARCLMIAVFPETAIIKHRASESKEWRLPVELQVIFTLEHIVEDAATAANAGFAVAFWVPGKTDARSPIILVREVCPCWSALIAREQQ